MAETDKMYTSVAAEKKKMQLLKDEFDSHDTRISDLEDAMDDAAHLAPDDGSAVIADFDPQADTVWKKEQTLSNAEKTQVQQNLGIPQTYATKDEVASAMEGLGEDFYEKKDNILIEDEGIFQLKDDSLFPVAHPDISEEAAILPQRLGELDVKEVLIAPGNESSIPKDAKVIEAFSFNSMACVPAVCKKPVSTVQEAVKRLVNNEGTWSVIDDTVEKEVIGNWEISNGEEITPDHTLVKYAVKNDSDYYGGEEEEFDDTDDGVLVDLGLPSGLLWAKSNIGAEKPTDLGLYFAWGETQGYPDASSGKAFSWNDYRFGNGGGNVNNLTKYNKTDGKTVLDAEDDAARAATGNMLRMPTEADFQELINNTNVSWVSINGVTGRKFVNRSDSSKYIFIPAAGYCSYGYRDSVGSLGNVWSASLYSSDVAFARRLNFYSGYVGVTNGNRCIGYSVRGVFGENNE